MIKQVEEIVKAYDSGYGAAFLSGRSLYDLVRDEDSRIRPLYEVLRRSLFRERSLSLVTYSLANGVTWFESWISNQQDRTMIERSLETSGLLGVTTGENEVIDVVRSVGNLVRSDLSELKLSDGRPVRFAILLEFAHHLLPRDEHSVSTEHQKALAECVFVLSQSLLLRDCGHFLMFHGDAGRLNDLVLSGLKKVHIKQPGLEEKLEFVDALENLYPDAKFDPDLDKRSAASMTVHTPNRSLEQLYRSSDRTGSAIGKGELIEQKERDVEDMSEHTLLPLDASRVSRNKLVGRNIEVPIEILTQIGERLASGDSSSPQNVLLVGAPGFGKTDLALLVARRARCPAYQMISPKGGIVGETERKARMQQEALSELAPAIAFRDEITESFPMGRNKLNGDSGASAAITAQLLTSLSDESRSGKTLLVATTNFPQVLGMAMRSRFVVIPILSPLEDDYTDILVELVKRISPNSELSLDDPPVIEAASKFYQKGASPRDVRRALSDTLLFTPSGSLKAEDTLEAAEMLKMSSDRESMEYSELQAIKYCSTRRFLPWHGHRIDNYRFPAHLSGIVDRNSGEIDHVALETRLRELGSFANV